MVAIFSLPSKVFAWFEYFTSILKFVALLIFLVCALAMVLGAGPKGYVHHGETWQNGLAFRNGFKGFGNSVLLAILAIGGEKILFNCHNLIIRLIRSRQHFHRFPRRRI
jgi:amino acid transporter